MLVDVHTNELGRLRAVFRFDHPRHTLIEVSINPVGFDRFEIQALGDRLRPVGDQLIADAFLRPDSHAFSDWDEVMAFVKQCHEAVRSESGYVITTIRIEDEGRLGEIVASQPAVAAASRVLAHAR
jgi:hypothetical protein